MNIIEALQDKNLFAGLLKDPSTWRSWFVFLRALFGLPITDPAELELFRASTGLETPPRKKAREAFVIAGRRSGKSFISSIIASYLACFFDWSPYLSKGERGYIFIVATDRLQARVVKNYISGIFQQNDLFRRMVAKETAESIQLKNNITIEIKTCSYRGIRGYTILAAILEEIAFWRSELTANPDREILTAIRPALSTIPGSLLIGLSSPYSRSGVLYDQFKKFYGQPGDTLIWKAPTEVMNPTIDMAVINKALAEDFEAGKAEWLAEWREDINAFLPVELIEACMIPERYVLPPNPKLYYRAFIDPSGGRSDSFTMAIAHKDESQKIILDYIKEVKAPFKPEEVCRDFAEILDKYEIATVESDRYAGEWPVEAFAKFGIRVKPSEFSASELYLELLPLLTSGRVELLDNKRLLSQLGSLERIVRQGGRDQVTHPPGGHDDLANAVAGACVSAARFIEPRSHLVSLSRY